MYSPSLFSSQHPDLNHLLSIGKDRPTKRKQTWDSSRMHPTDVPADLSTTESPSGKRKLTTPLHVRRFLEHWLNLINLYATNFKNPSKSRGTVRRLFSVRNKTKKPKSDYLQAYSGSLHVFRV